MMKTEKISPQKAFFLFSFFSPPVKSVQYSVSKCHSHFFTGSSFLVEKRTKSPWFGQNPKDQDRTGLASRACCQRTSSDQTVLGTMCVVCLVASPHHSLLIFYLETSVSVKIKVSFCSFCHPFLCRDSQGPCVSTGLVPWAQSPLNNWIIVTPVKIPGNTSVLSISRNNSRTHKILRKFYSGFQLIFALCRC